MSRVYRKRNPDDNIYHNVTKIKCRVSDITDRTNKWCDLFFNEETLVGKQEVYHQFNEENDDNLYEVIAYTNTVHMEVFQLAPDGSAATNTIFFEKDVTCNATDRGFLKCRHRSWNPDWT